MSQCDECAMEGIYVLTLDGRHVGIENKVLACKAADCMYRSDCYGIQLDFRLNFLCEFSALPSLGDTFSPALLPTKMQCLKFT